MAIRILLAVLAGIVSSTLADERGYAADARNVDEEADSDEFVPMDEVEHHNYPPSGLRTFGHHGSGHYSNFDEIHAQEYDGQRVNDGRSHTDVAAMLSAANEGHELRQKLGSLVDQESALFARVQRLAKQVSRLEAAQWQLEARLAQHGEVDSQAEHVAKASQALEAARQMRSRAIGALQRAASRSTIPHAGKSSKDYRNQGDAPSHRSHMHRWQSDSESDPEEFLQLGEQESWRPARDDELSPMRMEVEAAGDAYPYTQGFAEEDAGSYDAEDEALAEAPRSSAEAAFAEADRGDSPYPLHPDVEDGEIQMRGESLVGPRGLEAAYAEEQPEQQQRGEFANYVRLGGERLYEATNMHPSLGNQQSRVLKAISQHHEPSYQEISPSGSVERHSYMADAPAASTKDGHTRAGLSIPAQGLEFGGLSHDKAPSAGMRREPRTAAVMGSPARSAVSAMATSAASDAEASTAEAEIATIVDIVEQEEEVAREFGKNLASKQVQNRILEEAVRAAERAKLVKLDGVQA